MANAKKCDRCGKYYDKNESKLRGVSGNLVGVSFVRRDCNSYGCYVEEKDLCDECIEEFKLFLKKEK